jgi:uncharacterized membrane protein
LAEGISRIEAFSDGVFAIASTLLILEIRRRLSAPFHWRLWARCSDEPVRLAMI